MDGDRTHINAIMIVMRMRGKSGNIGTYDLRKEDIQTVLKTVDPVGFVQNS